MTAKRTLIRGGQVYDHDGDVHKPAVADILIEGDTIAAVARQPRGRRRRHGDRRVAAAWSCRA